MSFSALCLSIRQILLSFGNADKDCDSDANFSLLGIETLLFSAQKRSLDCVNSAEETINKGVFL